MFVSVAFTLQGKAELVATSTLAPTTATAAVVDSQSEQEERAAVAPAANTQVLYITAFNHQYDTILHHIM